MAKLTETLVEAEGAEEWTGVDVELQFLCFRSPRPCTSSPCFHVHLVLALDLVLAVLGVVGCWRQKKVGWWWLWMRRRKWMDGDEAELRDGLFCGGNGGFIGLFPFVVEV